MKQNRPNTKYIAIWKKTHQFLKKISQKEKEPMTVIVQRLVENRKHPLLEKIRQEIRSENEDRLKVEFIKNLFN